MCTNIYKYTNNNKDYSSKQSILCQCHGGEQSRGRDDRFTVLTASFFWHFIGRADWGRDILCYYTKVVVLWDFCVAHAPWLFPTWEPPPAPPSRTWSAAHRCAGCRGGPTVAAQASSWSPWGGLGPAGHSAAPRPPCQADRPRDWWTVRCSRHRCPPFSGRNMKCSQIKVGQTHLKTWPCPSR